MKLSFKLLLLPVIVLPVLLSGCTESGYPAPDLTGEYSVFAWNDLGMHGMNPTYDKLVIQPPNNNVRAQVIKRGNPPEIVTSGISVSYRLLDNTTSYNKRSYKGFWDN